MADHLAHPRGLANTQLVQRQQFDHIGERG